MTKEIKLCSACKGRGKMPTMRPNHQPPVCDICNGSGRVQIITTIVTKPYPTSSQ